MDSSIFLYKAVWKKSQLIVLASIIFLLMVFSGFSGFSRAEEASSQGGDVNGDQTIRQLAQQMINVGTTQYERRYYDQAEKTLSMARNYQEYLTAQERSRLNDLLDKAKSAALERNRALENRRRAVELFGKGELIQAKTSLDRIKDNRFLTEEEREQNAQLIERINAQIGSTKSPIKSASAENVKSSRPDKAKPTLNTSSALQDSTPQAAESGINERDRRIAELYYRSQGLYQNGRLQEAREGFIEVLNSGQVPPDMVKTVQDYLAQIDRDLADSGTSAGLVGLERKSQMEPTAPAGQSYIRLEADKPREIGDAGARAAAGPITSAGGYIEEIKSRRNIRQSHARAVVNNAVADAQESMNKGEFDRAEEIVERAKRTIKDYEMDLGDEIFRLYSDALKQLSQKITQARQESVEKLNEQKRTEAADAQRQFREQMETDRQTRIKTLLENAKACSKQQNYEAALGQLETLLAVDPQNDEALVLKDALEDMIYLRRQIEVQKENDKQRADILLKTEESGIPYADELTYPKNWREIVQKPTRQPDKPIGMDPADVIVYRQLDQVVDLSRLTPTMPFNEAVNILKNSVEPTLKIFVLWRDLSDNAEIQQTTEINMDGLPAVRLGTGLENLLKAVAGGFAELGYVVDNGVITVATLASLPSKMETRVYDITDLVGEPANFQQMGMMGMMGGGMGGMGGGMGGMGGMMGGMGGMGGMTGGMGGMGGYGGGGMGGYGGGGTGGYGGGGTGGYGGGGTGGYGGGGGGYGGGGGGYGGGGGGYGGGGMGGMGGGMGGMGGSMDNSQYRAEDLMYLIQDTIEPDSWYDYGGEGSVTFYPRGERPKKLAVLQTREVHAEIEKLLAELRKSLGHQVSIEARFLVVSENFLEDIGLDIDFSYNVGGKWGLITVAQGSEAAARADAATKVPGSLGGMGPAATATGGYGGILDDLQVSFILRMTHARTDAETLTAPKSTVLSGESANFQVSSQVSYALPPDILRSVSRGYYAGGGLESLGIQQNVLFTQIFTSLTITPIITQDKKNVLLNIMTSMQDLLRFKTHSVAAIVDTNGDGVSEIVEYPVTVPEMETSQVMTRVSVPDSGTLLLGGQKITAEIEKEVGVPILSKIPIIGMAFGNRSKIRDNKILLILVKPTIILQEERESEAIAALESGQ